MEQLGIYWDKDTIVGLEEKRAILKDLTRVAEHYQGTIENNGDKVVATFDFSKTDFTIRYNLCNAYSSRVAHGSIAQDFAAACALVVKKHIPSAVIDGDRMSVEDWNNNPARVYQIIFGETVTAFATSIEFEFGG